MSKPPILLDQKTLAETRIFRIEQTRMRFSNGVEQTFEKISGRSPGAVMILPMLDDQTFLVIREYAPAMNGYFLGFPKGAMDVNEDPLISANRELMEETGYGAKTLTHLATWSLSPAYFAATMEIVLAKNLYPQKLEGDEPEPIEVISWKINNIDALLAHPEFHESRSVAAALLLEKMYRD
ncbi:MAG: ADP compounds hydrolase NudE [Gammaproteobacteria bacterium CG_4_10_14_0_8_um_filter_38_16]|nr:MAG: ADP compounds hydrolase NudE [Gammaproteobacteria bacterium CG_4_10_14_0_8_um_filter_38_16]PJA03524.1 MAG: ADP compounds hydrolase NudE [Gammaproteobacteria bacterium CG_4_10_14_0_2_um_filter_38_22]PJB11146.1 MAG: ADP compounds hydrolase NudE [Gammaproteobacteria bacterium CG_4_9_14_3_um_filter_38_9]